MADNQKTGNINNNSRKLNFTSFRLTRTMALELGLLIIIVMVAVIIRILPYQYGAFLTALP
jgi:hypothetical protein